MLEYHKIQLDNGLRVIVHEDDSTPMIAFNILYLVGSRNESPEMTGMAHLFEHLMFSGSKHIKDIDTLVQNAGGENNAFTNNDHTNFHEVFPAQNLEVAFWIEADRMRDLQLTKTKLETQKKVVVEEFKETTINEPYGDFWHHISEMAFKKHPYRWPVIGLKPEHIEQVKLEDAVAFYQKHYAPNNAIISIAGNVKIDDVRTMVEKWFADIPAKANVENSFPSETTQNAALRKTVQGNVPIDSIYIAFRMCDRVHPDFYTIDLISDILSNSRSARFYQNLIKEKRLFSTIDAYVMGTIDEGLFIIEGKLSEGIMIEIAEKAIWQELEILKSDLVSEYELQKNKNQIESALIFSESGTLNKAINLCFYESIGKLDLINREMEEYERITPNDIKRVANWLFENEKSFTLWYLAEQETEQ